MLFVPHSGFKPELLHPKCGVVNHYTNGEYEPSVGFEPTCHISEPGYKSGAIDHYAKKACCIFCGDDGN